jgi:hypothetical protein
MTPAYIPVELRRQVRADAGRHCGYCRSAELLTGMPLEIEHIIPEAAGGPTVRENLWLACHRCNEYKGDRTHAADPLTEEHVALFNPRTQRWREHFGWSPNGTLVVGLTSCGRATVQALRLNNEYVIGARRFWVEAGWHPPAD